MRDNIGWDIAMTERVVSASAPIRPGLSQRCGGTPCGNRVHRDDQHPLSQGRTRDAQPAAVPPIVPEALRSPSQPLEPSTRAFFEPRFGHDFSRVRVHTDVKAAQSARAINAVAYTVGDHIAFDASHSAMRTPHAQTVLAHELTHVVQQRSGARHHQALRLAAIDSAAEREAARTGDLLARGGSAGPINGDTNQGVVHRAIGDILAGGAIRAIAGAAIGSLFGPIGALIGAGVGLLGGLAAGEVAGAERRTLTTTERAEATKVFGTSLDMSKVHIAESSVMSAGGFARTPFDTVYFPPGTSRLPFSDFMPWLIHELTHVWQYQHGISVTEKLWWALHGQTAYDYGGEAGLRTAALANKRFLDFNTEQQASIAGDFYRAQRDGRDTSAYQPFIAQLQAGGAMRPAPSAAPATPPAAAPGGGGP